MPLGDGATPLFVATQNNNMDVVLALLRAGARHDIVKTDGSNVKAVAKCFGRHTLHRLYKYLDEGMSLTDAQVLTRVRA